MKTVNSASLAATTRRIQQAIENADTTTRTVGNAEVAGKDGLISRKELDRAASKFESYADRSLFYSLATGASPDGRGSPTVEGMTSVLTTSAAKVLGADANKDGVVAATEVFTAGGNSRIGSMAAHLFTSTQDLVGGGKALIDPAEGTLKGDTRELKTDGQGRVIDSKVSPSLRKKLNTAVSAAFENMVRQGSDVHSIVTTPFAISKDNKVVGYGVWGGAPGDIGAARVTFYDLGGKKAGSIDEQAV